MAFLGALTDGLRTASVPSTTPTISLEDAIAKAEAALSGTFNEHPPTLEFVAKKDGSLALTHVMQIQNDETGAWFEAFIDAHTGELVQLTDFVAKASVGASSFYSGTRSSSSCDTVPRPPHYEGSPYRGLRGSHRPPEPCCVPRRLAL